MKQLLEQVEKYIFRTEEDAEAFIEELKQDKEYELIDRKITQKETKESIFFIVTVKKRFMELKAAKESMGL